MKRIIPFLILSLAFCLNVFAEDNSSFRKNIMIVFDASGSMGDPISSRDRTIKIIAAKSALRQVLQNVDSDTNVGLFVFGNVSTDYLYKIGPVERVELYGAIESISAGGGTPLGEFMKKACDKLLEQRAKQFGYGSYKMLVVTDGEATDASLMNQVAPEIIKRGITLDVIGVGMESTHQLARMSSSYRAANDSKALKAALVSVVAETSSQKNGQTTSDDYNLISGISDEQAKNILTCVSAPAENQPLFEKPKVVETKISTLLAAPDASQIPVKNAPQSSIPVGAFIVVIIFGLVFLIVITGSNLIGF